MKKLLISLLLGTAILTTGCTQAKDIRKINNIGGSEIEENIEAEEGTEESPKETREKGIIFIDNFLKENLSDCYNGYYADENGITINFVDDGIVELLEADQELYNSFVELNMNVCKQVTDILKADDNYNVCVTYTDQHKEGNKIFTNTFFIITDGEITYNTIENK